MKSQFELARSFLRQVIDKGRQLHDSDGEGLSEDEPGKGLVDGVCFRNKADCLGFCCCCCSCCIHPETATTCRLLPHKVNHTICKVVVLL